MKLALLVLLAVASLPVHGRALPEPGFRFDSDLNVAMEGTLTDMVLVTAKDKEADIKEDIIAQLFYLIGALNTYQSAADLGHADVKISKITRLGDSPFKQVKYSAKLLVSWDKTATVPAGIPVGLPAHVDDEFKKSFFAKYGTACVEDPEDPDLDWISFYYYIRPQKAGCDFITTHAPAEIASYSTFSLKPSGAQTQGKSPEYGKVWEDNKLVATMIVATNKPGATSNSDSGIRAYNEIYLRLRGIYGTPESMTPKLGPKALPGKRNPDVEMEWKLDDSRRLNTVILLIDKTDLQAVSAEFAARYAERTKTSDFVSYNGHSAFGANIKALAKMGTFVKGQWQLFMINGCDTFFYVDDSLRAAHEAANPGSKPYKFFNIITNGMANPFTSIPEENLVIIESMIQKDRTYKEILAKFTPKQHAVVMGEEDSNWPKPF